MRDFYAAALLAVGIVGLVCGVARAEDATLSWSFQSNYEYTVQLEFYAQDRDAAWPGGGQAYVLDDYEVHTYRLNCWAGEKICYGAWVDGDSDTYWGVGLDDQEGCEDCCVTCSNGEAGLRTLNP